MREAVKHRLIGAGILAAVAVLFLPSFFKDKQLYQVDTQSQIPQRPVITAVEFSDPQSPQGLEPAPEPEAMFVPEAVEPAVADATVADPAGANIHQGASSLAASSAAAQVAQSAPASQSTVPDLSLNNQAIPDAWVIQVASLSVEDKANGLRDQLLAQGYKAYVRATASGTGRVYRIYVGPNLDKAQSIALKQKLDKQLKVNSLVLPFKP